MKKIDNKVLLLIFLVLAIAVGIFYYVDQTGGDRSFRNDLIDIDSAGISAITVYPRGGTSSAYQLSRTGKEWKVVIRGREFPADSNAIRNTISTLLQVRPARVAGKGSESWKQFDLTDSLSVRVVVEEDGREAADFRIGKLTFAQTPAAPGTGRNQNFSPLSHIRVAGDDRVYVAEGYIAMLFSDNPAMFRNRTLLRLPKESISLLTFTYPGDSSFVLSKSGNSWTTSGRPADSAKVESFLATLANLSGHEFADDITPPAFYPFRLAIEGEGLTTVRLSGFFMEEPKNYLVESSLQPGVLFGSANPGLFYRVFPSPQYFLKP